MRSARMSFDTRAIMKKLSNVSVNFFMNIVYQQNMNKL